MATDTRPVFESTRLFADTTRSFVNHMIDISPDGSDLRLVSDIKEMKRFADQLIHAVDSYQKTIKILGDAYERGEL